ncbi:MAG: helix-turn-helix domain-containing protein [Clostridia bacterium]|nr:helix-turn-helix domain-containing protein [Clostridia bacterium]
MDRYVTGSIIKELREKKNMTQAELAEKILVSDKTVSKWETGKGYPDITMLPVLAENLGASVSELLMGTAVENTNVSANMLRSKLHVCPVCGNVIFSMGETNISCHGITLPALSAEDEESEHTLDISIIEDEYYVSSNHDMSKSHYISFLAAVSYDRSQLVKLYPEGNCEARFKMSGVKYIYYYCNRDGLFRVNVQKRR